MFNRGKIETAGLSKGKKPRLVSSKNSVKKSLVVITNNLLDLPELQYMHLQNCEEVESWCMLNVW